MSLPSYNRQCAHCANFAGGYDFCDFHLEEVAPEFDACEDFVPFEPEKVEDLINVKGIGEKKLETLKGLVEVKPLEE